MPKGTIETAIGELVADAVTAALAPYAEILDRLEVLMNGAPARRGPGRPRKVVRKGARRAARGSAKKVIKLARKFNVGDAVTYNQGRGRFGAKVVEVDAPTGLLVLERLNDGKRIVRPATKVAAADVAPAAEHEERPEPKKVAKKTSSTRAPRVNLVTKKAADMPKKAARRPAKGTKKVAKTKMAK